ncbi:MAG: Outer membrane protein OprM [Chlamydiae bacterium]|nr:Outer membrane protein OprM [Chlamydiota bacterium]
MRRALFGILLSLILAAGCIKIPTDEACCKMMPTPCLEYTTQTALEDNNFYEGDFPDGDWWEMFEDPQLSHLICTALSCNPTMQMVKARVEGAEAAAKIKKSHLFPTIGFSADLDWQYLGKNDFFRAFTPVVPGNISEYEIDLDFTYEFDFWSKNRNTYRAALGIAKAMEAERQNAILALSSSVAVVYFKLQANLQKLVVLKEERKILTKLFQLTQMRQNNALDDTSQRLDAEEQLFIINKNILMAKQKIELIKNMLNLLIGQGPDAYEEVEKLSSAPRFDFPLPTNISSNLLGRRPDLMAYIWRVESGAHLVGAAKAEFYPRVDLYGLAGLDSVFFSKLFRWESRTASLKPAIHLPIFTAGRLKANLREKQAEFDELIYAYNDAVLRAVKEVSDQVITLKITSEKLQVEERIVANKIQNRKIMALRYKNAVSNLLDLLETQDAVLQQEFMKIKFQYKRVLAAIQLIKALGGGYCTEEMPFD